MKAKLPNNMKSGQVGVVILEALIAIVIFSIGILGLVGALSTSVNNASDAQYRTEAAFLADTLVAQMQLAKPTSGTDARSTDFLSPSGTKFTDWQSRVTSGATALPGASLTANNPTVEFVGKIVTISIFWQTKSSTSRHQYVVVTALE